MRPRPTSRTWARKCAEGSARPRASSSSGRSSGLDGRPKLEIEIRWHKPVLLASHWKIVFQDDDLDSIPEEAGVYFFSRKYGNSYKPFYVGESQNLRTRLKGHLSTVRIADVLRGINVDSEIKQGSRY